jgi:hypothetical protein
MAAGIMSALSGHAKAARIMAIAFQQEAGHAQAEDAQAPDWRILNRMAVVYSNAASAMEAQIKAECSPPPAGPAVPIAASPTAGRRPPQR